MPIAADKSLLNAYRADGLGDVKPSILIGGKGAAFVPNVNLSFACESAEEKYFLNINRSSVKVAAQKQAAVSDKVSLTIGNENVFTDDRNCKTPGAFRALGTLDFGRTII